MKPDTTMIEGLRADPRVEWTEDVIRYADVDGNDHVNNTVFSVLCESGRVSLFRNRFGDLARSGRYFVVARVAIDFHAELRYPGRVRTGTWVTRIGRTSFGIGQVILSPEGIAAATAECVSVVMDSGTRRPAPIEERMRRAAETALLT